MWADILLLIFSLLSLNRSINRNPMYAFYVRQDPILYNLAQIEWAISTYVCRQVNMLAAIFICFHIVMIMSVYVQAPRKSVYRLV